MAFRLPLPEPRPRRSAQPPDPPDPPLYPPPAVWFCTECFDHYDALPDDGNCPNLGHAPVKLTFASIKSTGESNARAGA